MKTTNILFSVTLLAAGLMACGDDSEGTGGSGGSGSTSGTTTSTTTGGSTTTGSTTTGAGAGGEGGGGEGGSGGEGGGTSFPDVPELGTQLERMGRPAINTALVDTFAYLTGDKNLIGPSTTEIRNASEDAYNAAPNGSADATAFTNTHMLQLTVLDSLDGVCGNQPLYGFGAEGACLDDAGDPDLVAGPPLQCYGTLATVLNLDAMWVKTTFESCGLYLGVEADGAATLGSDDLPANEDCGGRRPVDDVIRNTYSVVSGVLADGDGNFAFAFDDLIDPPADLHPDGFPYLAPPSP